MAVKELLNAGVRKKIPKLYETEHEPVEDKIALVKFFHPLSDWTWYVIEFDGDDLCWGLVSGHEVEFGYFSLAELRQLNGPFGISIERDIFFRSTPVRELAAFGQGGAVF